MKLRKTNVLVTGASRGIGELIARQMADKGAHVVLVARNADAIATIAREIGGTAIACDLRNVSDIDRLVAQVESQVGHIDVLVNNAGVDSTGDFLTTDPQVWRDTVLLNLAATIDLSRRFLPGMVERRHGHVVNVTSIAAVAAFAGMATYAATKAGISQFTAGLRADLKGTNVGTTLVEISAVDTTMAQSVIAYPPTGAAADRMAKFGLLTFLKPHRVAYWTVRAVEKNKRHVRLPYRAWVLYAIAEIPRRMTEWLVAGVSARPENYRKDID
jgi:short-subunit dehydrogenase